MPLQALNLKVKKLDEPTGNLTVQAPQQLGTSQQSLSVQPVAPTPHISMAPAPQLPNIDLSSAPKLPNLSMAPGTPAYQAPTSHGLTGVLKNVGSSIGHFVAPVGREIAQGLPVIGLNAQYQRLYNKGQISSETYNKLINEDYQKAGLDPTNTGQIVRKTVSDLGLTALNAVGAGEGAELAGRGAIAAGAKVGAKYGAAAGGLQALGENKPGVKKTIADVGLGAVGGAAVGAALPAAGAAVRKVFTPQETEAQIAQIMGHEAPTITAPSVQVPTSAEAARASAAPKVELPAQIPHTAPIDVESEVARIMSTPTPETTPTPGGYKGAPFEGGEVSSISNTKTPLINKVKAANNPFDVGARIDSDYAKSIGVAHRDIPKTESLEALADVVANSGVASDEEIRKGAIGAVIRKYGADTPEATEFNRYRVAVRDAEQRSLGGKSIYDLPDNKLNKYIKDYETTNPEARGEITAINKQINGLQDRAVAAGHLDAADVEAARATAPTAYTPISRALPEEVQRASMNSNSRGSIAKQSLLQNFEGANTPIDHSFNSLTDYVHNAVREVNRAKLSQKYAERVKAGIGPEARFTDTTEALRGREELKGQIDDIKSTLKQIKSEKNKDTGKVRVARRESNFAEYKANRAGELQQKAVNQVRKLVGGFIEDPDAQAAYKELGDTAVLQMFNDTIEDNVKGLESFRKKLLSTSKSAGKATGKAKDRQAQVAALDSQIQDMRNTIKGLSGAKSDLRGNYAELQADPTTGLQIVSGRMGGRTFKIETTPEVATFLQGLGEEKLNGLLKAARSIQQPFRSAFTGALNPPFALTSALWNAVMGPLLGPQGLRSLAPSAIKEAVESTLHGSEFGELLVKNGIRSFTGNLDVAPQMKTAEAIAAERDFGSKLKFAVQHPGTAWHKLDSIAGKVENFQRTALAKSAYDARLRKGGSPEEAIADAVYAYNNILPNFGRTSALVRQADSALMYTNATVAGQRALFTAIKRDPIGVGTRLTFAIGGLAGLIAHNYSTDNGKEFYEDMVKSGRTYNLDNSAHILLPGAKKDPKTGKWSGVIKFPLPPELRPLNHALWESFTAGANGSGVPLKAYAQSAFDFITGTARTLNNPAINTALGLATNKDLSTGGQVVSDQYKDEQAKNQKSGSTSSLAIRIGDAIGVSPMKVDYVLRNAGFPGQLAQSSGQKKNPDGTLVETNPLEAARNIAVNRYVGATGMSDASTYFQNVNAARDSLKTGDDRKQFDDYMSRQRTDDGKTIQESPAERIKNNSILWSNNNIRKAVQNVQKKDPSHDPMWDLPDDKLKEFINYQKQYTGDSAKAFIAQQNPWIIDVVKQRNAYFDQQNFQGTAVKNGPQYPTFSDATQKALDGLDNLDPAAKSAYYSQHPEVFDAFKQIADYVNASRKAEGAPELADHPDPTPQVQNIINTYNALPTGDGKQGGNATRSAWITANPALYKQMTDYYTQNSVYDLAKHAALAQYKGGSLDQTALKAAYSLGQYDITKNSDGSYSLGSSSTSAPSSSGGYKITASPASGGGSTGTLKKVSIKKPSVRGKKYRVVPGKNSVKLTVSKRGNKYMANV